MTGLAVTRLRHDLRISPKPSASSTAIMRTLTSIPCRAGSSDVGLHEGNTIGRIVLAFDSPMRLPLPSSQGTPELGRLNPQAQAGDLQTEEPRVEHRFFPITLLPAALWQLAWVHGGQPIQTGIWAAALPAILADARVSSCRKRDERRMGRAYAGILPVSWCPVGGPARKAGRVIPAWAPTYYVVDTWVGALVEAQVLASKSQ